MHSHVKRKSPKEPNLHKRLYWSALVSVLLSLFIHFFSCSGSLIFHIVLWRQVKGQESMMISMSDCLIDCSYSQYSRYNNQYEAGVFC